MISIAVCGPGEATEEERAVAAEVGRLVAEAGAVLVCGGLGGVMDAAAEGARRAGGVVVGILPGPTRMGASPHLTVAIPTGLGEARNAVVARAADAVVAVGGGYGTLSEIALALKTGIPVIGIGTWQIAKDGVADQGIRRAAAPAEAVAAALTAARG